MNVCWGCSVQRFQKAIKIWSLSCGPTYSSLLLHCWFTDWTLQHPPVLSLVASTHSPLRLSTYTFGDALSLPKSHARKCDSSCTPKLRFRKNQAVTVFWPHQLVAFLLRCVWPLVTLLWRDRCETGKEIETFATCAGLSSALIPQHRGSGREIETKRVQYLTALILARCTSQWLFPDNPLRISLTILCLDFKTIIKHLHLWAVIRDLCFQFSYPCPWLSKGLWYAAPSFGSFGWVGYADARVKLTGAGKQSQAEQAEKQALQRICLFERKCKHSAPRGSATWDIRQHIEMLFCLTS